MSNLHEQQHDGDAITIFCVMRPKPDTASTLRESLASLVEPTRAEPGCIAYNLYEAGDGTVVLFEIWRTQRELAAHQAQPDVRTLFDHQLDDLLTENMSAHFTRPLAVASAAITTN